MLQRAIALDSSVVRLWRLPQNDKSRWIGMAEGLGDVPLNSLSLPFRENYILDLSRDKRKVQGTFGFLAGELGVSPRLFLSPFQERKGTKGMVRRLLNAYQIRIGGKPQ